MKKILYTLAVILAGKAYSQIGINTSTPKATLDVAVQDSANPKNTDGVIIPRVTSLNNSETKETGLLIFLDFEDPSTQTIERGFYYWNGTQWIPFYTSNQITTDRTIVVAQCKDTFDEGPYTMSASESDIRNLGFLAGSIKPSSASTSFSINSSGALVVSKKGYYSVTGVVSMNVNAVNSFRRDAYDYNLLVNGNTSTVTSAYGFPNNGNNYSFTSNTPVSGVLYLNAGDTLKFRINRYQKGVFTSGNSMVTIPVGSLSNITLRYMGDF